MNLLPHLPDKKKQEILDITSIIREIVHPEMIILFGSYATNTWVEDSYIENGIKYNYTSDYDFLVITKDNEEKEYLLTNRIINRARIITSVPVNCLLHDISYVNEGLEIGQYFFSDIVKQGIVLFDSERVQLARTKELSEQEKKDIAKRYFDQWFSRGSAFLKGAIFYLNEQEYNLAAFNLHQAAENFYNTILLVFTGYKPKTHNLEKLRLYAKPHAASLRSIFPERSEDKNEGRLFDLLRRGYVDARYKNDYVITKEELIQLFEKLQRMQANVKNECSYYF